jgi:hypothetical protein
LHESQTLEVGREKTSGSYIGFSAEAQHKTRSEHFSGRAGLKKISVISGRKNPAHDLVGPRPRPGRAARAFYSVKQLKTVFRTGIGPKKFFADFKISAHARPVRFLARAWRGRAQNAEVYLRLFMFRVSFAGFDPWAVPEARVTPL